MNFGHYTWGREKMRQSDYAHLVISNKRPYCCWEILLIEPMLFKYNRDDPIQLYTINHYTLKGNYVGMFIPPNTGT